MEIMCPIIICLYFLIDTDAQQIIYYLNIYIIVVYLSYIFRVICKYIGRYIVKTRTSNIYKIVVGNLDRYAIYLKKYNITK